MKEDLQNSQFGEISKNVDYILDCSEKLEHLVVRILDLAKADLQESECNNINLYHFIQTLINLNRALFNKKNIQVSMDIKQDLFVSIDQIRLGQIIENLLTNAAKYSNPDLSYRYVNLTVDVHSSLIQFTIEDNGVGIPKDKQLDLFKMFSRFHPRLSEGSGLGMSIVKRNIEHLGGDIHFISSPDGTKFSINIPNKVTL